MSALVYSSFSKPMKSTIAICFILMTPFSFAGDVFFKESLWTYVPYKKHQRHTISFEEGSMIVDVKASAGVLAYPLEQPQRLKKIYVKGSYEGSIKRDKSVQGSSGQDDFILRVGLITKGTKTMSMAQKIFAPRWLKTLFDLNKSGGSVGIGDVYFYTFYDDLRLKGTKRVHPNSEIIREFFTAPIKNPFAFEFPVADHVEVLALWIGTDGDDTNSSFRLKLDELSFQ